MSGGGVEPFGGIAFWGDDGEWVVAAGHVDSDAFGPWVFAQVREYLGDAAADELLNEIHAEDPIVAEHGYATPSTFSHRGWDPGEWWCWSRQPTERSVPITAYSLEGVCCFIRDLPLTAEEAEAEVAARNPDPLEPLSIPKRPEDHEGVTRVDVEAVLAPPTASLSGSPEERA